MAAPGADAARLYGPLSGARPAASAAPSTPPIDRHPYAREKMAVREGGREAVTHWELQASYHGRDGKSGRFASGLPAQDRADPPDPGASCPISTTP